MRILTDTIAVIAGAGIGALLNRLAGCMIGKRVSPIPQRWYLNGKWTTLFWAAATGAGSFLLYRLFGLNPALPECFLIFSIILILSACDAAIRKIPNETLLAILVADIAFMIANQSYSGLPDRFAGLMIGLGIFLFPLKLGKQAGAGDLKYAAVIGFSLGFRYTVIAFAVMAAFYLIGVAVLLLSKKGTLKSMIALGPYMSAGFMIALAAERAGFRPI